MPSPPEVILFSFFLWRSDVTEYLQLLLRKSGYNFHTTAEKEVVRQIKEKTCYVALNPTKEEKEANNKFDDFQLPDGNFVKVRRFRARTFIWDEAAR